MTVTIYENADGLIQKYGTNEAKSASQGGFICTYGAYSMVQVNLDLTNLTTTSTVQSHELVIPSGALIESVEATSVETAVGASDLSIGLIATDLVTTTDITSGISDADEDCLLDAYDVDNMAIGEHERYWQNHSIGGSSGFGTETVGAAVGEILVTPCFITALRNTTAFTGGKLIFRVYFVPNALSGFGEVH